MKKAVGLLVVGGGLLAGCSLQKGGEAVALEVTSPDGRNAIVLRTAPITYEVKRDGKTVVAASRIGLRVDGTCLCAGAQLKGFARRRLSGQEAAPIYKKAWLDLTGEEGFADFGDWGLRLVARNDGVAYRFETKKGGTIKITNERADVTIPCTNALCRVNFESKPGYEERYGETRRMQTIRTDGKNRKLIYLPFVYEVGGKTVAVTESDVYDYPIWNLMRTNACPKAPFGATFAKWPAETMRVGGWGHKPEDLNLKTGGRWLKVVKDADYLVETAGTRTFPWRTFVLADRPIDLCANDIVRALARPAGKGRDFSWVKPGKVAWDWWNDWNLEGVPFKAGCNTRTYEYYIDFAAQNGVEYIIFDEGWSEKLNIWKFHPDVDVKHLIDYANARGVGIILWMAWGQVAEDEEHVAAHFAKLGAKGFKVDFMDRGDAGVERFLWKFADACARHKMVVDYHGAHRPTGMSRAYPNVLNYEGVPGLEQMKWFRNKSDFMDNDLKVFYGRMTAGPMDYTPGAMINYPIGKYAGSNHAPGSVGTRCHQMALMALYEAPLQMLCDSPTNYEKNKECFKFMAATPVVWDETRGLDGTPETLAVAARRKGAAWHVAAIADAKGRNYTLDTSFLGGGTWQAEIFKDAVTSAEKPMEYCHETRQVKAGDKLDFTLAPGGGFVVRFGK